MKLKLENITLFGVDCVDIHRLILASEICQKHIEFGDVKLLTSESQKFSHPQIQIINPITSHYEYSKFILKEMNNYIDTEYALIIQYDGFILNPFAWSDSFYRYDYIGAPYVFENKFIVGNGGFSLRSKKLLKILAEDNSINIDNIKNDRQYKSGNKIRESKDNEDEIITRYKRDYLEHKGIEFAPLDVARRFSFEGNPIEGKNWDNQFGFHNFHYTDISKYYANELFKLNKEINQMIGISNNMNN